MAVVITMPKFGLTMTEGTVSNWLTEPGNIVKSGEPLFEVETDKITNAVEAPETGVLRHIFIPEGETAKVGEPLAIIAQENEDINEYLGLDTTQSEVNKKPHIEANQEADSKETQPRSLSYIKATPYAKKIVREQGRSLQDIKPSGPNGVIVSRDIESVTEKQPAISPLAKKYAQQQGIKWEEIQQQKRIMLPDVIAQQFNSSDTVNTKSTQNGSLTSVTEPMSGIRKVIAERMSESWKRIPHVTIQREVDVTALVSALSILSTEYKEKGIKLTITHFLIKIVANALEKHPILNAWCDENQITYHKGVNMGVAVSVEEGLVVPVIFEANRQSILEIADVLRDLTDRAKENKLTADEIRGSTFTISNLGMMNIDGFAPIINPPETGILGVGRIIEKPIYQGDDVVRRSMLTLSLSFDHRALDGVEAARFLNTIDYYIQEPLRLLVKGR